MTRASHILVVAAAAALVLAEPPRAWAQIGWQTPPALVSGISGSIGAIFEPQIAADPAGNAIAVWMELEPTARLAVYGSRYVAATQRWLAPERRSPAGAISAAQPRVAMDADGHAIAMWEQVMPGNTSSIFSTRYSPSTGTWTTPEVRSTGSAQGVQLAMNATGDALAAWSVYWGFGGGVTPGIYASRYATSTDGWTTPERIDVDLGTGVPYLDVAIDAAGNAVVVWAHQTVQSRRYAAATNSWEARVDLSAPITGTALPFPKVVMNGAGDAGATWMRNGVVEASRRPADSAWTAAVAVSTGADDGARPAIDSTGNVVVAWYHNTPSTRTLQANRFAVATSTWSGAQAVVPAGVPRAVLQGYAPPALAVDVRDNVHVVGTRSSDGQSMRLATAFYAAASGTWSAAVELSTAGHVARNPGVATDAAGNALAVWFQSAGSVSANLALRWSAAPPAPVLAGVVPSPGALAVSFALPATPDPMLASTTVDYSLDGGLTWTPRTPASVTSPLTITGLTDRVRYDLRLRARNVVAAGPATASIEARSGTGTDPTDLRVVSRSGNRMTFTWVAPAAGVVPTGYLLEGWIGGEPQILASVSTGGTATTTTLIVPNGVFFVRVVAVAGGVHLGSSFPMQIWMNTLGFPQTPHTLLGSASGDTLALSWRNRWEWEAPTAVRINVSGAITTSIDLPLAESFTFTGVPPGTYNFTVETPGGPSHDGAPSNLVTLTFPGTCAAPPGTPAAFSASTQSGRVFLDWLPPPSGAAVTSYVVSVTGAFTGSFPLAVRTFSAAVPPGSYTVSVASVGPCGTSSATPAQTVVVP